MSELRSQYLRRMPEGITFLERSGSVEAFRLDANGLEVLILPEGIAPVTASQVTYRVGSRHEWAGVTGATHFLEHIMFKGTERFHPAKGTSVFQTLQRLGATVNATTWYDRTNYYEVLPTEHLGVALEIEADRMRGALISEEDVDSERTVILNELDRGENEPIRKLSQAVWSTAFIAHGYHHPTIGWRSDVENVSARKLRHFYDSFYWPENATLSLVGRFDPDEVLPLVRDLFGAVPRKASLIEQPYTTEPEQRGERRTMVRMAGAPGAVMIGYKVPDGRSEEMEALELLSVILCMGKNSRLYRALQDRGLTSNIYASPMRMHDPGLLSFVFLLAPQHGHEEVEREALQSITICLESGITQEELDRARRQLLADEAFTRDGPMNIVSALNGAIAAGDWRIYTTYMDRMNRVTPDRIKAAAEKYLIESGRTIGWHIPT